MKILITGSNGNLARKLAKHLVQRGHSVEGIDIGMINENASVSVYSKVDLRQPNELLGYIKALNPTQIPAVLINAAAIDSVPEFGAKSDPFDFESFDDIMHVNLRGPVVLTREIGNLWKNLGSKGVIINISSIYSALSPDPEVYDAGFIKNVLYGASKAALDSLTRQSATIYARYGIRVNSIQMAGFSSPVHSQRFVEKISMKYVTQKMMNIESLFCAVDYLIDENNHDAVGMMLRIDGGYSLI